jgi:hypothetical protein
MSRNKYKQANATVLYSLRKRLQAKSDEVEEANRLYKVATDTMAKADEVLKANIDLQANLAERTAEVARLEELVRKLHNSVQGFIAFRHGDTLDFFNRETEGLKERFGEEAHLAYGKALFHSEAAQLRSKLSETKVELAG